MQYGNRIRIGLLKHVPEMLETENNMSEFEKFAKYANKMNVKLFVTCECYLDGYYCGKGKNNFDRDKLISASQVIDSSIMNRVRKTANKYKMHIVFGFSQKVEDGIKNSALLVDDKGIDIGIYHKTHLLNHDLNYIPGDDIPVFDTKLGNIGIMICADRRWPEVPRTLKLKGADMIINPTYGMCHDNNKCWMKTRAYENETYVAFAHPGQSLICNPSGDVEAELSGNVSGILVHDLDLDVKKDKMVPNRRPSLYGSISEKNRSRYV